MIQSIISTSSLVHFRTADWTCLDLVIFVYLASSVEDSKSNKLGLMTWSYPGLLFKPVPILQMIPISCILYTFQRIKEIFINSSVGWFMVTVHILVKYVLDTWNFTWQNFFNIFTINYFIRVLNHYYLLTPLDNKCGIQIPGQIFSFKQVVSWN